MFYFNAFRLYGVEVRRAQRLSEALGYGIGAFQAGSNIFLNGVVLGVLYGGTRLMLSTDLSPGDLMAFLVAAQTIQRSLTQLSVVFGAAIKGTQSCGRVLEVRRLEFSFQWVPPRKERKAKISGVLFKEEHKYCLFTVVI